jgi:hypothetical protein
MLSRLLGQVAMELFVLRPTLRLDETEPPRWIVDYSRHQNMPLGSAEFEPGHTDTLHSLIWYLHLLEIRCRDELERTTDNDVHLSFEFHDVANPYLGLRIEGGNGERLLKRDGYQNWIDYDGQRTRWSVICGLIEARESGADNELLAGSPGNFDTTKLRMNKDLKSLGVAIRRMPNRTGWSFLTNLTNK